MNADYALLPAAVAPALFGLSAKRNRPPCRAETDRLTELGNILIYIISYDDKKAREEFLSILDK